MKEVIDLEVALFHDPAASRDINFAAPTWAGAVDFLAWLGESFQRVEVLGFGEFADTPRVEVILDAIQAGYPRLIYEGGADILSRLQVFIYFEADRSTFVELTFFPEDIKILNFNWKNFLEWIDEACTKLHANRCYCRFQSESWEFGDERSSSGVFLVYP